MARLHEPLDPNTLRGQNTALQHSTFSRSTFYVSVVRLSLVIKSTIATLSFLVGAMLSAGGFAVLFKVHDAFSVTDF
jgi:hypothetical protein